MKIILQAFEPMPQPFANANANGDVQPMARPVRKSRFRFSPVVAESRLFHAL
jgi:hypothetical protein